MPRQNPRRVFRAQVAACTSRCRPLAAYPQTNQAPHLPGPLAFSIVIRDQRVMATYISLRVALLAVVAAVCTSSAAGLACCPTCNGNNGECYVSDEMYATYTKGGDCLNACPGRDAPSCRWAGCACVRVRVCVAQLTGSHANTAAASRRIALRTSAASSLAAHSHAPARRTWPAVSVAASCPRRRGPACQAETRAVYRC